MPEDMRAAVVKALMRDEGLRLKPYRDTVGKLTIGVGRNLDDRGITEAEAIHLLANDVDASIAECRAAFPWFDSLNTVRQAVLVNMVFNMGLARVRGFANTLAHVSAGRYDRAADGMLASKWARQVKGRAVRLAQEMRTGEQG